MFAQVFPMFQDYSMFSTQSVNNPNVNLAVSLIALAANVLALGYILLRAKKQGIKLIEGNIHSSDVFYRQPSDAKPTYWELLRDERGCLCVEMESFALFANAEALGKNAACLLTISDSFVSPEITTAEQRQTSFTNMMKVALGAEY